MKIRIKERLVGEDEPVYFVADIAANHDGDLGRAKKLIELAKAAGADAAKFQHHRVAHYVSKLGFESLGGQLSHQKKWDKPVFEVYKDAQVPLDWTAELKAHCDKVGIHFFSTAYDLEMVDLLDPYVPAFKVGSGDINFPQMLTRVASKHKPVLLATGASTMGEVQKAVGLIRGTNPDLVLMQCNTNYTGSADNFKYINLNVLKTYRQMYPDLVPGLSDHTPGHATVLGAIALGARVVEKHFTDDTSRKGPDHPFSMDPAAWREMVDRSRELEAALGSPERQVAPNEQETLVLQRRCLRACAQIKKGTLIPPAMIEFQRPAPPGSFEPSFIRSLVGRAATRDIREGEHFSFDNI